MCGQCRKAPALNATVSVVALCEECIAANAGGFYGKPGETFPEIRARQRAHYATMLTRYGH